VVETDQAARQLLGEHYCSLRYEDLLASPWEEMSRLWDFLGADPSASGLKVALDAELIQNPDADWQAEKASDIASALTKGKRGTWRELFTPHDQQIFQEIAGDILATWHYESQ
jgi:hypothetical protein